MEFEQALEVVSLALNREIARPLTEVVETSHGASFVRCLEQVDLQ